ncbi:MAG: ATP-binding protein [Polyangiales bacterium]
MRTHAPPSLPPGAQLSSFRLSLRLMTMAVLLVLLLGAIVFVLVDRIFTTLTPSMRYDLEWKARHGVQELAATADLSVVAEDREGVAAAARELVNDPDVVAIHVLSGDRTVFDYRATALDWSTLMPSHNGLVPHGDLLISSRAVSIEGIEVGRVGVAVSTRRLRSGMELRTDILAAGAVGAALALLFAAGFMRMYVTPLIRVTEDAFRKLEKTTRVALESARVKAEFLANMSHEIRTPMNGILGVTKLAIALPMSGKLRRYLEVIDGSARGLLTILNDVLDFSKMEAGKYTIHPYNFAPRDLVSDSIELFADRAREKDLTLCCRVAADVPETLFGDADRIKQILANLLGNAVKFTDAGEVFVHATMRGVGSALRLRVEVRDTGCGIAEAAQEGLFRAFTQADGSSVRRYGGTGLGLAIGKRLAELMNGDIGFESEVGRGSTFWFEVAVAAGREDAHASASRLSVPNPPATRTDRPVLVVDDNEVNRFVAVEHLHALGFRTETASNGREAVEAVAARAYAAVLMDCQMPVMDGYEATRTIRSQEPAGSHLPIIALTAHALVGERESVLAAGMDDYISKPVQAGVLERTLSNWVAPPSPARVTTSAPPSDSPEASSRVSPALAALFLRDVPAQVALLRAAVDAENAREGRDLAHKLKGGLYAIGATALGDACEAVRRELGASAFEAASAALTDIEAKFAVLVDELRGTQEPSARRAATGGWT